MAALLIDRELEDRLRREREESGAARWDEVWDGVYVMSPLPNNQHQGIAGRLHLILGSVIELTGRGRVFPGVNVSDQPRHWKKNYRCPDVAVYLNANPAEDRDTHWLGGPDLAVEIISPDEDPHAKLDFYAKVGTRELLIVNRDPWRLELHRLDGGELKRVGISTVEGGETLASQAVPFTWRLTAGEKRPVIAMTCTESGQVWDV